TEGLEKLPIVQVDPRRMFNAFYNLINNAIPEVPSGGSITVRGDVSAEGDVLILSVKDTGRGMSPAVRESLFTDRVISQKKGGTGLGIKIAKDSIDAHGGSISVTSTEGEGTTFWIRLSLRPPGATYA
ncbi:MAG: ATP-binding protein, partial [Candidatus Tectomicrobia bacterium]